MLNRRDFLKCAVLGASGAFLARHGIPSCAAAVSAKTPWERDAALLEYFDFPPEELLRLRALTQTKLFDISTVAVANKQDPFRHLGWPVAAQMPDGRAAMVFTKAGGHHDYDSVEDARTGHYALWSEDGARWEPSDLLKAPRLGKNDGMHCVGWAPVPPSGKPRFIAIITGKPKRVYLSDDSGRTWRETANPFGDTLEVAPHCGPAMVNHPEFGLVAVFGQEKEGKDCRQRNFLARTLDAGETWQVCAWENQERTARSVEPAAATFGDGHMLLVTREFHKTFGTGPDGSFRHTQHLYRHKKGAAFETVAFDTRRTNITANGGADTNALDTPDLIFNPVSGRLELLQSHRWGPATAKDSSNKIIADKDLQRSSLNLWSIAPEDLLNGSAQWRFDGTLIERVGYSTKGNKDGLHPGGSLVDEKNGVQRIFVYAGWRRSPSGIFCITRSLDTERLRAALLNAQ